MRFLIIVLALLLLSGCTAMMVGGGDAATYPAAKDCPEGQIKTEEGCKK